MLRRFRKIPQKRNAAFPKVSVIIPVANERKTIVRVIREAFKIHPRTEVIVVVNGSTDGTKRLVERLGVKVIYYKKRLGHDTGRSIGAGAAKGDIIVFIDGDMVIPAKDLTPLVKAVDRGVDVALNKYSGSVRKRKVHHVILAKYALNIFLSRPDLKGASLTAVPHAISSKALKEIGAKELMVPPKALAIAVFKGLTVKAVHYIPVGRMNPRRRRGFGKDPLGSLIVGDHLEAIHWLVQTMNKRGGFTDLSRKRELAR